MRNECWWACLLIMNFLCISIAYYRFGRLGLFAWVPIATVLANIQVVILVKLFGLDITLGNVLFAGSFLVTDILSENYGKDDARKAVHLGFFSMLAMTALMQICIHFTPSPEGKELFAGVQGIFSLMPRLAIASVVAYWMSQLHDIWAYDFLRQKFTDRKYIWIRNNGSTMVSQILDNAVFTMIAFYGVYPVEVLWEIFIGTYLIKFIVSLCDTPFVYLAEYLKRKGKIRELI